MTTAAIDELVDMIVADIYKTHPSLKQRFGEKGVKHTREDNHHHFRHLATAYEVQDDQVFIDYAHWLNDLLQAHGMTTELVIENFERISKIIGEHRVLSDEHITTYQRLLTLANEALRSKNAKEGRSE